MEPPTAVYITEDLVLEILSRLPVKALLRLRSVCKSWLAIIDAPDFPSLHLSRAPSKLLLSRLPCLRLPLNPFYRKSKDTYLMLGEDSSLKPLDFPFRHAHSPHVVTTVNGLVCVAGSFMVGHGYLPIILWNPAIRRHVVLPNPTPIQAIKAAIELGYDSATCDYKVLAVREDRQTRLFVTDVYSLNSNTWRRVDVGPTMRDVHAIANTGAFSGGKIHWFVEIVAAGRFLYSFDMVEEVFAKVVDLPPGENRRLPGCLRVMAAEDESLHLIELFEMPCSIWKLMEGSDTKYWEKLCRVDWVGLPASLVCRLRNGEFLMDSYGRNRKDDKDSGVLAVYDPRTKHLKDLETRSRSCERGRVAWVFGNHRESLVLIDREPEGEPVGEPVSGSCQVRIERATGVENN